MALTLLVGTLNRVMIVELKVPATLVAVMVALPVLYAPFRALIGFRSDTHRSALGWRRVPFIWMGTMVQFGGLAVMPFALLVLAGGGNASQWPVWVGWAGAGLAFLLVGAGLHTVQTAGLALATDLAPRGSAAASVVGLMYVMLLLGTIVSALALRRLPAGLQPRPPGAGDPGRGGGHAGAEQHGAVEAGDRATRRRYAQARRCSARRSFAPGLARLHRRRRRATPPGGHRAWARWPSACRTCCSSPMAARCWAWGSATPPG